MAIYFETNVHDNKYCNNRFEYIKNIIHFTGTGNAFSTGNNNSFEFTLFTEIYGFIKFIYELPMTTCKEYINNDKIIDRFIIMISHLHEDHCGGLATYLQYLYFVLNINIYDKDKLVIVCPDKDDMYNYLRLTMGGIDIENLNIFDVPADVGKLRNFKKVRIIPIEVKHVKGMNCCGFITKIDNVSFYYTGDCNKIPSEIIDLFNTGKINFMISELSENPNPVHLDISYFDKHFNIHDIENGRIIFTHLSD